ncbi:Rz-like spanin [Pseudomonas phage phi15]|uniref:Putative eRzI homolog n=1 Tax=Pseudomonas phage phi15 TaxID=988656 RepID=F0V709_9CAUD|nr:Rz-like spanin [Pseudomonas phage phi15]CBZ42021.1 putative eRzI homolog [Pseudomonas phage phi15]
MFKQNSTKRPVTGLKIRRGLRALPVALLIALLSLAYGCASKPQTPPEPKSKVTIEASLMVKPNYTERLLKLLSE